MSRRYDVGTWAQPTEALPPYVQSPPQEAVEAFAQHLARFYLVLIENVSTVFGSRAWTAKVHVAATERVPLGWSRT